MDESSYQVVGSFTSGRNGFGSDNTLNKIYYYTDNTNIYVGISGALTSNDNIVLFFNFSGYAGRGNNPLAGSGSCGTGVFRTSSTPGDYGLDGAIMDMDVDFALAFNEGNSSSNFYTDAARYGTTSIMACGYLGNTSNQSGSSASFNAGGVFGGTGNITVAYRNTYNDTYNNTHGIEFSIPISAFAGVDNTQSVQFFAIITNASGFMSNETIPGDPGASNLGNDANLSSISGQDFFTDFKSLPINLTYFSGQVKGRRVHLSWSTASEQHNDYMAIERSAEGVRWQELGRVPGAGAITEPQHYAFIDEKPLPGLNYYRLRQVDYDGATTYHKVISVHMEPYATGEAPIRLYPSPARHVLQVIFDSPPLQPTGLYLYNAQGQLLQRLAVAAGAEQMQCEVAHLPRGMYFVRIEGIPQVLSFFKD